MKFYTDPGYFFELWFKEIQRDIDTKKAELRKKKEGKRVCMIKGKLRTPSYIMARKRLIGHCTCFREPILYTSDNTGV